MVNGVANPYVDQNGNFSEQAWVQHPETESKLFPKGTKGTDRVSPEAYSIIENDFFEANDIHKLEVETLKVDLRKIERKIRSKREAWENCSLRTTYFQQKYLKLKK